jgi:hypothetical protein
MSCNQIYQVTFVIHDRGGPLKKAIKPVELLN